MNKQWYVYTKGQQLGPYSWDELWQKARSGAIAPNDQVWSQSLSEWTRADRVEGLFPSQTPPRPPAAPPHPDSVHSTPACSGPQPKKGGKGCLIAAIVVILLLAGGAAAVYYFYFMRGGDSSSGIVGSWYGTDERQEEGYFQFMNDGTVNLAVPVEGYWTTVKYRLVEDNAQTFLEIYDDYYEEWEQVAEIRLEGKNNLFLTDVWDGVTISLQRISDQKFQEVISRLEFYAEE